MTSHVERRLTACRSKMAANEASAVASLRTYSTALQAFQTTYGTMPSTDLSQLGPSTTPSSTSADLVDNLLGVVAPTKSGYTFAYKPDVAPVSGIYNAWSITANPTSPNVTGQRTFFIQQDNVIHFRTDGTTAGATDPTIG